MLYITNHSHLPPIHLIGHLYLFLDYLTRSSSSQKQLQSGRLQDFYVREALSFIEQNFQNEISVEDIAAFCNLNAATLEKFLKMPLEKIRRNFSFITA